MELAGPSYTHNGPLWYPLLGAEHGMHIRAAWRKHGRPGKSTISSLKFSSWETKGAEYDVDRAQASPLQCAIAKSRARKLRRERDQPVDCKYQRECFHGVEAVD